MAKLLTKKYKNNNSESSAYNKTYGRFVYTETISTDEFAAHISSHGSPFDRATVMGVLASACDCLLEMTLDSKRVRLGDLGTFYMSAESEGVESEEDFGASNIKKVHLRFLPNMKHSYCTRLRIQPQKGIVRRYRQPHGKRKEQGERAGG